MAAATDRQMCSAIERWARSLGWLPIVGEFDLGNAPWSISTSIEAEVMHVQRLGLDGRYSDGWHVSPHAALVWALVLEARPLRDGSPCRRCRGRGTWDEWAFGFWPRWADASEGDRCIRTIYCSACNGAGLADLTDAYAQHVLDAQPRQVGNPAVYTWIEPGAADSAAELHVLADRLQASACSTCGRPGIEAKCPCGGALVDRTWLGLAIAHLLSGKTDGTEEDVKRLLATWTSQVVVCTVVGVGIHRLLVDDLPEIVWVGTYAADVAAGIAIEWASQPHARVANAYAEGPRLTLVFHDRRQHRVATEGMVVCVTVDGEAGSDPSVGRVGVDGSTVSFRPGSR